MWRALIIDDEELGRKNLQTLLNNYCKSLTVIGTCESIADAKEQIAVQSPEVIFLDIHMSGESGFDLLDEIELRDVFPLIILVTADDRHAIRALKLGVFDYILKPIDVEELQICEAKINKELSNRRDSQQQVDEISTEFDKISISHNKGIKLIKLKEIIALEADNCYTIIHIFSNSKKEKFIASRTLGDFVHILKDKDFFRVHKSFIINISQIREYRTDDSTYVIMNDNSEIHISRRRNSIFKNYLKDNYDKFIKSDR